MNAVDIIFYGDKTWHEAVSEIRDDEWQVVGATSQWTPKDVVAHIISYELVLGEVLAGALDKTPMPLTEAFGKDHESWTAQQVALRRPHAVRDIQNEYAQAHACVMERAKRLSPDQWRAVGTIPWYGAAYSLDDFVVYANYAHKREHATGLKIFLRLHRGTKR